VEIAVNKGSAAEAFGLKAGDRIELEEIHCSE
jgi:S-adenosylmethionine hydrolase